MYPCLVLVYCKLWDNGLCAEGGEAAICILVLFLLYL